MKIIIAPDSFKQSLSAEKVAEAIAQGLSNALPTAELVLLPVADGGEGTTDALIAATQGQRRVKPVTGPLGELVEGFWGVLGNTDASCEDAKVDPVAVIEMAAASGLDLISSDQRNPLTSTTRGMGELILAALDEGANHIIVGLGGSATNDGGAGMLQALGVALLDVQGQQIPPGGGGLSQLHRIDIQGMDARLANVRFEIACDVDNPLIGPNGASAVFGPQKGATPAQVRLLDKNLQHFAQLTLDTIGQDIAHTPGAGAAGGLGAAFLGYFNAQLSSGIDIVLDAIGFENHLKDADLVVTGEGRIDAQSIRGKTPVGVAKRAKAAASIPVIALAGALSEDAQVVYDQGIDSVFSVVPRACSLEEALQEAESNVKGTAENIGRVLRLSSV